MLERSRSLEILNKNEHYLQYNEIWFYCIHSKCIQLFSWWIYPSIQDGQLKNESFFFFFLNILTWTSQNDQASKIITKLWTCTSDSSCINENISEDGWPTTNRKHTDPLSDWYGWDRANKSFGFVNNIPEIAQETLDMSEVKNSHQEYFG